MIFVYYGPDRFSIGEAVQRQLRAALPAEAADLNLARLSGDNLTVEALRFACEAVPFLADRRAVVIDRLFARLTSRRPREPSRGPAAPAGQAEPEPRQEPKLAREVAEYLPRVPANTLLIFVEPDAPPKTGPLAAALQQAAAKQQFFPLLAGPALTRWIKERAKAAGTTISDRAAHLLATYVGGDLQTLSNEVKKLAAYAGPGRAVDVAEVQLLVSQASEANIFELVDAIGEGGRAKALTSLHALVEHGERPERILVMVGRQVRLLLQARDLLDQGTPADGVAQALGLSPFPARKILEQARLFRRGQLEAMHRRVLEADVSIKTGLQEAGLALDLLVAELAGGSRQ